MKRKILSALVILPLVICVVFKPIKAEATLAVAVFPDGKINYSAATVVGSNASTLSRAVNAWNSKISSRGYSSRIGLTAVNTGEDVIVSFTGPILDYNYMGRVLFYFRDIYGDLHIADIERDMCIVESAFMYVYPNIVEAAVNASSEYTNADLPNCILKTTIHEFGHILGLAHPRGNNITSIMDQGVSNRIVPTEYDMNELYRQWY